MTATNTCFAALATLARNNNRPLRLRVKAVPAPQEVTRFVVGETYGARSACDHDTIFGYTVTKRTASNVWLEDRSGCITRRKLSESHGEEFCFPAGKFSMCPVLRPHRKI